MVVDTGLLYEGRVMVLDAGRSATVANMQREHQGQTNMLARAQESVWWPGLSKNITSIQSACAKFTQEVARLSKLCQLEINFRPGLKIDFRPGKLEIELGVRPEIYFPARPEIHFHARPEFHYQVRPEIHFQARPETHFQAMPETYFQTRPENNFLAPNRSLSLLHLAKKTQNLKCQFSSPLGQIWSYDTTFQLE